MLLDDYLPELGAMVKRLRVQRGMTESQLAVASKVSTSFVQSLESGLGDPTYSELRSLAHSLRVGLDYLLGLGGGNVFGSTVVSKGLMLQFRHGRHKAEYLLRGASEAELAAVLNELRSGLGSGRGASSAIARAYLKAVALWPKANPSDLWLFLVNRAYCDVANHPVGVVTDLAQSWKRASGGALEEVLRSHYGRVLAAGGLSVAPLTDEERGRIMRAALPDEPRLIPEKADVLVTKAGKSGDTNELVGVVHVKASLAERRTDDVPLSTLLIENGYLSVFWTMDCKSFPARSPVNLGEYGPADGERSDKRLDIEENGYFSAGFSYNRHTLPTKVSKAKARIQLCDFSNPDDAFSRFVLSWVSSSDSSA